MQQAALLGIEGTFPGRLHPFCMLPYHRCRWLVTLWAVREVYQHTMWRSKPGSWLVLWLEGPSLLNRNISWTFCWLCIIMHHNNITNLIHFHNHFIVSWSCTCFGHQASIFRRHYTSSVWCELCAHVAFGWLQVVGRLDYWAWGCGCRSGGLVGCGLGLWV
jgi:hypothetical protein